MAKNRSMAVKNLKAKKEAGKAISENNKILMSAITLTDSHKRHAKDYMSTPAYNIDPVPLRTRLALANTFSYN